MIDNFKQLGKNVCRANFTKRPDSVNFGLKLPKSPVLDLQELDKERNRRRILYRPQTKRRLTTNLGINYRITSGLSVNFYGQYSFIRDQLNITGVDLTDEERLLRLRELQSGSSYFTAVGLSYTFGSVFANVVNPRLRF